MKPKRSKVLGLCAAALIASAACGTSQTSSSGTQKIHLALFVLATANAYSAGHIQGATSEVAKLGGTIKVFDGGFDAAKQYNEIQDATTSGLYNAFLVVANDGPTVEPGIKAAIAKGIRVAAIHTPLGPTVDSCADQVGGLVAFFCYPFISQGGTYLGVYTEKACAGKDPCNVGLMVGSLSQGFDAARRQGYEAELKKNGPNVHIVAEGEAPSYLRENAVATAQAQLQSHPNIDVWASAGSQISLGIEQAALNAGRKVGPDVKSGQLAIVSTGASSLAVQAIKDGRWFSDLPFVPVSESTKGVDLLQAALNGSYSFQSIKSNTTFVPPGIGICDPIECVITPLTVGTYQAEWNG